MISPLIVRFKVLFQQLCEAKTEWDEPLSGKALGDWKKLTSDLQRAEPISLPRCCIEGKSDTARSYTLQGFCDASQKELCISQIFPRFLCAKTRVAPIKGQDWSFCPPCCLLDSSHQLDRRWRGKSCYMPHGPQSNTLLDSRYGQGVETICAEQSDGNQRVGPSPELETLPRGSKSCRHPLKRCLSS